MLQIQIMFRKGKNMNRIQKIHILILLTISVFFTGVCCSLMVQAKDSAPETAYRELLEGRRMLHIDKDMLKILKELGRQGDFECGAFSMKEILEKINADYYEHYDENNRIAGIEYTYLDCGKDGSKELAVRFDARSSDMFQLTFIIIYENGTLYLRHAFESWSRNSVLLNQYGYIWESGSNGATSGAGNESFVDSSGRAKIILDKRMDWSDIDEPEICQQVYGTEEYFFCNVRFQIQDKEYECLLNIDGEDPDDEDFALFKKLYEEKYGKIYAKAEIEKILEKLRKKIGITEEMMEKTEPDWESLQTAAFKDQVREIDLKETRKKAQKENTSIVKKGWKTCGKDSSRIIILKEGYLNYNGGQAIKYALGDYFNEKNISDTEWNLLQTISYGDMLHAVTVQNEEGRIICLMLCSDAAVLGLPEYTEYLLVADCHLDKVGVTIDHSALDWNSYDTQAKQTYSVERPDKLCNYYYANMALNQYLTEQDADPSMEWELDSNAVCRMDYRKIIVRFISGEQEIVMAIDANYDRYSVIIQKGLIKE